MFKKQSAIRLWLLSFLVLFCQFASTAQEVKYKKLADGVLLVFPGEQPAKLIRVKVINDHIIRVSATPENSFSRDSSLMVENENGIFSDWNLKKQGSFLLLNTGALQAKISLITGQIGYADEKGNTILAEKQDAGRKFSPVRPDDHSGYSVQQIFENRNNDALYGLGENQLGLTNIRGKNIVLAQHNSEAFVPFIISPGSLRTNHTSYGILWDNNSITTYGDPSAWLPLDSLALYNSADKKGGLSANYRSAGAGNPAVVSRQEKNISYTFLEDLKSFPEQFSLTSNSVVTWEGTFVSPYSGLHSFLFYWGGYLKVWINDSCVFPNQDLMSPNKEIAARGAWRQSWNPAEALVELPLSRSKKYQIKIQWMPDGTQSFISVKWKKPGSEKELKQIAFSSELGKELRYYLITGKNMDSVISGYRLLTGRTPVMPKWAYGFWQSREHYDSAKQILDVARTFREQKIPIDNIVQDWFYWKKDQWGSQQFDPLRYPDPKGMIDSLHNQYHVRFMISVWPKFYVRSAPFRELWDKGWLYRKNVEDSTRDWVGYISTFYDAFNKQARKAVWDLVNKNLFSLGVDAWWLDASEPDIYSNTSIETRKALMAPLDLGSSTEYFNAYPLENNKAFYFGQRQAAPEQRVFILTRSAWGGSQRYAAATWSGDVGATWRDMKNQIAAGINFSMSGIPYWTMDIGGFATEQRFQKPKATDLGEWIEQTTRWYQFGAFCPIFRAHGQPPYREPYNVAKPGSAAYNSILYYDKLRYRMLPYIYSLAGAVYLHNGTIMRGLAMDFPFDAHAANISDQYMFGPDLLVNPVYHYGITSRPVYLPAERIWYDLYSGKSFAGGQTINAEAPFEKIPVFVKSGAIIPFGPSLQYSLEKPADTITIFVYTGHDGNFNLYEDDGLTNEYEQGKYSVIPFVYTEKDQTLNIGKAVGDYPGMLQKRTFLIKWVSPVSPRSLQFENGTATIVGYEPEKAVQVRMSDK